MNLLSSLLKYTADQIAALRAKNTSQDDTVSGINTRLGTAETKVTNMEAQLATAISAVTVDSEVQNIRVGDDQVTYTSAGEAVRTQFSNVKADIDAVNDLIRDGNTIINPEWEVGTYTISDGQFVKISSTNRLRTTKELLLPAGATSFRFQALTGYEIYVCYFENGVYKEHAWGSDYSLPIADNSKYVLLGKRTNGTDTDVSDASNFIVSYIGGENLSQKVDKNGHKQVTAENCDFINIVKNLYDNDNADLGYFTNWSTGYNADSGYRAYRIHVYPDVKYSSTNKLQAPFTYFGTLNGAVSARTKLSESGDSGVSVLDGFLTLTGWSPSVEGYLYVTISHVVKDTTMVVNAKSCPLGFYEYDTPIAVEFEGATISTAPKILTVEKDGSGDYTTLKEGIENASNGDGIVLKVGSGTYDLIEEFGADYFNNLGAEGRAGLKLKNNVHVIFASNAFVVCNYTGSNDNVKTYFSPFNTGDGGGFTLENLNLECSNVRYGVHDETNSQVKPYANYYKNCSIKIDNSANSAWSSRQCIGGGLGKSAEITIENCYFESTPSVSVPTEDIVSYHNASVSGARSNIAINNCYFAGADGCRCSYYGVSTETSRMMVSGCSLGKAPRKIAEGGSSNDNFELIAWNNVIRS